MQINNNKGTAFTEFLVVLPLFIIFLAGSYDLGRALTDYLALTQVVHEGVRVAASIPELEQGTYTNVYNDSVVSNCTSQRTQGISSYCLHPNQYVVQSRIENLMKLHGLWDNNSPVQITSAFTAIPLSGTSVASDDTIFIKVDMPYNGIFPLFKNLRLSVQAQGPYLFERFRP